MAEYTVCFFDSQVTSNGVIMVFLQDFYLKDLNLGYIQYGFFVEEVSELRLVVAVDFEIRIWLPGGQPLGYPLRKRVNLQEFW